MRLIDCLKEAASALRQNKLRSGLTAIGVIIGVAGIIAIGAAEEGGNKKIEEQMTAMGAGALIVTRNKVGSEGPRGPVVVLADEDEKAIREQVPGIEFITRELDGNVTIVAGNASWTPEYWGVDAAYADVFDVRLAEGRFFDEAEVRSGAKVIVLGATVAKKLFSGESPIDKTVRMGGVPMRIIGVRTTLGFVGGQDYDNHVFVPITTARSRLAHDAAANPHQLSLIDMKIAPWADRDVAKEAVLALLRERKHSRAGEQEKFDVFDPTQYVELMNATHGTLGWLLGVTALILVAVGGVGIMNIMLVSVAERTHEIGLRIALGARKRDILAQFLIEAVLLCAVAGAVGFALGVACSYAVAQAAGWPLILSGRTVAMALLVSAAVGILFGFLPARRAANLDPIDALRRE
ncbi:ABC transporter permease [Methylocapsa palsarum]|uniref:Putative ABC transport system permease protein n=1 Tax=Methylocapsa palsarum TaxID=1612308 RepID=A0A1I4BKA7_9HYPH|nr:ABC transporter permease [Methylocapsa palsarum]SFK69264.1 putative ABC transport system permease protein [Methylocapsa palsarum]